ncbi:hypothetical protein [Halosegnis longus]|uniref:hypothetical protein n=1 Tax=Halosegnis longus TaxID=2216012 RepID=UPI00096A8CB5|nr:MULTISPECIES: hypothetical protein [Halobacteriales]
MSDDEYLVEIKRSARKVSPDAGRWVRAHGTRRAFATKALAAQWARIMSPPGRTVWVQDAAPWDESDVDGYVVGGRRVPPRRDPDPGEQESLADVE